MKITSYIKVGNINYSYIIEEINDNISRFICKKAKINQEFLNEDIVNLLKDLPNLIKAEQKHLEKQDSIVRFRLSRLEKMKLQKKVKESEYSTLSGYIKSKIIC